jgi:glycosyltransferase involved in cell wall biosynthesis
MVSRTVRFGPISIAIANSGNDQDLTEPDAALGRYHALVGWAEALAQAGASPVTVVQRFGRDVSVRRNDVEYRFVAEEIGQSGPGWFRGDRMVRMILTSRPDVVHVNGCIFPSLVRHLRSALGRRTAIVVQDHGGSGIQEQSLGFRSWPWRTLHRFGLRAADGFLFTARELAAPWLRAGIIDRHQAIHEIPEASTDLELRAVRSERGNHLPGHPALLWVARLDANKDPLTVLAGFERVTTALPDAALTMVFGEDRLLPEVRSRIASSQPLASRVHLRGRIERSALPALYEGADLFVLGSHREVASFALIEALSFGVTPVVTDIPAFRVLTDGGRLGMLFPPGEAEALARAIERLGQADFVSRREAVREHFARELSWSVVGEKALAIYRATAAEAAQRCHENGRPRT